MKAELDKRKIQALGQLYGIFLSHRPIILGATALSFFFETAPHTEDLDITIGLDIEHLPSIVDELPGWRQSSVEHRFITPDNLPVDIIPAGPEALKTNEIKWPKSGERLNLTGFRLVYENAKFFEIETDLKVQVAIVPVIAILKIIAYVDRPATRQKDLRDLVFILEKHVGVTDERRWSDEAIKHSLQYDETAWFVTGLEIGKLVNDEERNWVERFIKMAEGEDDSYNSQALMLRYCPSSFSDDPEELLRRFDAFALGLACRR